MPPHGGCAPRQGERPQHEVADIFRAHGQAYRATHVLRPEQRKVIRAITACRTAVLGGHLDVCPDCGDEKPSFNSCRNRHCPKCQALAQARWVRKRQERILPTHYFHVVFTLPGELRPLGLRNQKLIYDLLFSAASRTLLELGLDPGRLGALLGITAVLHTWTRELCYHPHLHCIVTGGGLSPDSERWVETGADYLFPFEVLSRLFRGKFLDSLSRAYEKELLELTDELLTPGAFEQLKSRLYEKGWVVYAKPPFAGVEQVFSYLGRYTHRVAISNNRIVELNPHQVTIATRDGNTMSMSPQEFIRRFLMHVLPDGFVKIRHYGLMASGNVNTKLELARDLLKTPSHAHELKSVTGEKNPEPDDWQTLLKELTGIDIGICPACGSTHRYRVLIPRTPVLVLCCRSP